MPLSDSEVDRDADVRRNVRLGYAERFGTRHRAAVGIAGATPTPVVDHIKIAPSTQSIAAGQTSGAYTARAYDSYGNHWDVTADTTFSIDVGS